MTHRRDKGLSHDGCIAGLRMESDFAKTIADQARERTKGDVAELARYLLRTGLGFNHDQANKAEAEMKDTVVVVRGLRGDAHLSKLLDVYIGRYGFGSRPGAARHIMRQQLGYTHEDSLKREAGFAAIAAARQGLHGVFHGAGE